MASPKSIRIRSYNVGFGDCFLLTFEYKSSSRSVLIDFGTSERPKGTAADLMQTIARDIADACGGKLHAVVATHRHLDHISGFEPKGKKGAGAIIADLKPDVVVMPWTEHPDADTEATFAPNLSPDGQAFKASLRRTEAFAESICLQARAMLAAPRNGLGKKQLGQLQFLGELGLPNLGAVKNLLTMGAKRYYVHSGSPCGIKLPGVKVRVLGPPTLEQSQKIRKQRSVDETEFWHLQAQAGDFAVSSSRLFLDAGEIAPADRPLLSRWLLGRMQRVRGEQILELVRILDSALNNTSVILLFEVGRHKLLFPGDAQIENWSYAFEEAPDKDDIRALLEQVTVYKVGHHGSLNATPRKSLWETFKLRSTDTSAPRRLTTLLSTMPGKHGDPANETEVPRRTLLEALQSETNLKDTEALKPKDLYLEHTIAL